MMSSWKKENKLSKQTKKSCLEKNMSFSVHQKHTKRKKKCRHKKVLTQGVHPYLNHHSVTENTRKNWDKTQLNQTSPFQRSSSSFCKSHHTSKSSLLHTEFDSFAQEFQRENQRLRNFIELLPSKTLKSLVNYGFSQKKEGLSHKIKKQSAMLKTSFSPKKYL